MGLILANSWLGNFLKCFKTIFWFLFLFFVVINETFSLKLFFCFLRFTLIS